MQTASTQEELLNGTNSRVSVPSIAIIMTTSSLVSAVIFYTYPHNLNFLLTTLSFIQHPHSITLYLNWLLGLVLDE